MSSLAEKYALPKIKSATLLLSLSDKIKKSNFDENQITWCNWKLTKYLCKFLLTRRRFHFIVAQITELFINCPNSVSGSQITELCGIWGQPLWLTFQESDRLKWLCDHMRYLALTAKFLCLPRALLSTFVYSEIHTVCILIFHHVEIYCRNYLQWNCVSSEK